MLVLPASGSLNLGGATLSIPSGANVTLLGADTTMDAEGRSRHFDVHGVLLLSGVALVRGYASTDASPGATEPGRGGSLLISRGGHAVVQDCSITHSAAALQDGAISVLGALDMARSSIRNSSVQTGINGAIGLSGSAAFIDCVMSELLAVQSGAIGVGSFTGPPGLLSLIRCAIANSTAKIIDPNFPAVRRWPTHAITSCPAPMQMLL